MIKEYRDYLFTQIMKIITILLISFFSTTSLAKIPSFLDWGHIKDANFICLGQKEYAFTKKEQKYFDILWQETLKYLKGFAQALAHGKNRNCLNSDLATTQTHPLKQECIMKNDDMQILVRHIYSIIENPKKSKKCFNPKKDDIYPDLNNYFFSISDKYKIPD